jgi:TonB family protein
MRRAAIALALMSMGACRDAPHVPRMGELLGGGTRPDLMPLLLNSPFAYPPELWQQRVEGNVTLRLFVDSAGAIRPESTRVAVSSGVAALDSAAVRDARQLRFRPAVTGASPVSVALLLPVFFRHPAATMGTVSEPNHSPEKPDRQ